MGGSFHSVPARGPSAVPSRASCSASIVVCLCVSFWCMLSSPSADVPSSFYLPLISLWCSRSPVHSSPVLISCGVGVCWCMCCFSCFVCEPAFSSPMALACAFVVPTKFSLYVFFVGLIGQLDHVTSKMSASIDCVYICFGV